MFMKRIVTFSLVAVTLVAVMNSCSSGSTYKIKGHLLNFEGEIEMNLLNTEGQVINSCVSHDGVFEMEGSVEQPMLTYLNNGFNGTYPLDIPLILENAVIRVKGDIAKGEMDVTGTKANVGMVKFKTEKGKLAPGDKEGYLNLVKELFEENTDNFLSALLISNLAGYVSDEELLTYCERVPENFFNAEYVSYPRDAARSRLNTAPGKKFTDIEVTDADSTCVRLSDVAGKGNAVMLTFWSSKAGTNKDYFPALVTLCEKYRSRGLTMFTVAFDYSVEDWNGCVSSFGLFGYNYRPGPEAAAEQSRRYAIENLPYSVLIAPDGTITARGQISLLAEGLEKIYSATSAE